MSKEISVFRIDYEMRSKEEGEAKLWSACIAAYDQPEAVAYLGKFLGRTFKILQLGRECGLHALTDSVRQKVIDTYLAEQKAAEKVVEKTAPKKTEQIGEPTPRGRSLNKK